VEKYPQANLAIITGSGKSLLAVDVDPLNGGEGRHYVLKYPGDICKSVGLTNIGDRLKSKGEGVASRPPCWAVWGWT
jgi:hypothetical protein